MSDKKSSIVLLHSIELKPFFSFLFALVNGSFGKWKIRISVYTHIYCIYMFINKGICKDIYVYCIYITHVYGICIYILCILCVCVYVCIHISVYNVRSLKPY